MCLDEKTSVNLRIEGKTKTIFEGTVYTCGHRVTTPSGGTRHCNGTNNDTNPCTGPTCTTALDDGNKVAKYGFDGTYSEEYDDFFITSIGIEKPTYPDFWAICLNFILTPVGGCQQKVKQDDQVLFAYATDVGTANHFLKLSGPEIGVINVPVVLLVTDGTGRPMQNANVDGHVTGEDGKVSITFPNVGTHTLKAERQPDSIRSNGLKIMIIVGPVS
ncbi:hypothetical protein BJV78DRAFT_359031 [Lactifluus subvellereus]|nr:hypothetical protein BJV78DRAFT_359031 [Lactifluus subvellereus]